MSRVLIVGGTGFIGRHVAAALGAAGHQVTAVGRTGLNLASLSEAEMAQRTGGHDAVINAAGLVRSHGANNMDVVHGEGAERLFTTPTVVIQPITGIWLAVEQGWALTTGWIVASLALYALAGACWLPVVWLQLRMHRMADEAGTELPPLYHRYFRIWFALGWPAFAAMVAIVGLMVFKPSL